MDYSAIFCIKFDFGVPLEDIFPPDDIHPRLHNLFRQTQIALAKSPLSLREILGDFQGSLKEKLSLKDDLLEGKLRYRRNLNAGGFVWLIRHFLGLLPLPLFPTYTDGREFDWDYLASQCKLWGIRENYQLDSDIFWTINTLPNVNIILIHYLIQFLRYISAKDDSPEKLDKRKVIATIKYFCSSLFLRPYVPGFVFPADKLHRPLLYYLIYNWPRIKKLKYHQLSLLRENLSSIQENEEQNVEVKSTSSETSGAMELIECGSQTSSWLLEKTEEKKILSQESVTIFRKEVPTADSCTNSDQHFNSNCHNFTDDEYNDSAKNKESTVTEESVEADTILPQQTVDTQCYDFNYNNETPTYKQDGKDKISRKMVKEKRQTGPWLQKKNKVASPESVAIFGKNFDELPEAIHSDQRVNCNYNKVIDEHRGSEETSKEIEENVVDRKESEHLYEQMVDTKCYNLNYSSETEICKKDGKDKIPRDFIKKKIVRANRSLVNVISKFNEKIRTKQEANTKLGNCKYDLLSEGLQPAKFSTPKVKCSTNFSPSIKYKKLLTL